MAKPLVNKKYLLEKYPGKGGWTYARIPEIKQDKKAHFGWVKVRGTVGSFEFRTYPLIHIGDSNLFLPLNAPIITSLGKKGGDFVHVILYPDNEPLDVPYEILMCLKDEPKALKFFNSISESEQKFYIQYIYSSKKEETKIERMAKSINRLAKGLKLYVKDENNSD